MRKANWRARARGPRPPPRLSEDASGGHTKDCRNARTFSAGCWDNRCRCWRTTTSVAFGGPCESSARWRRFYVSFRTIETWWYDYTSRGYQGLTGKSARTDAGKSRSIDEELGLWLLDAVAKSPNTPLSVLYRHWDEHGRELPSLSSVQRFLASRGYDRRTLKAGRLESGPQKAFEAPAPNDLWMVDFACGPTLRSAEGKSIVTHLCVLIDDHSRLIPFKNLRSEPLPARPQGRTALRSHPHGSRGSLA